jgi:hypothetical protein
MSGKYFNKGVKALDAPDIGHVAGKLLTKSWSLEEEMRDMIYPLQKSSKLVRMY